MQLYFGGLTTVNEGGGACYLHWNQPVTFMFVINAVIRHTSALQIAGPLRPRPFLWVYTPTQLIIECHPQSFFFSNCEETYI